VSLGCNRTLAEAVLPLHRAEKGVTFRRTVIFALAAIPLQMLLGLIFSHDSANILFGLLTRLVFYSAVLVLMLGIFAVFLNPDEV
jgi:hypothetical protein